MESSYLLYIFFGAVVGFAVGVTGVGGGSLMTPLLLLIGFPPHIAIGTDLLYASITKFGGALSHHYQKNIDWALVRRMAIGSVPAAIFTALILKFFFQNSEDYKHILTFVLGIMLVLTSATIFFRQRLQKKRASDSSRFTIAHAHVGRVTTGMGVVIGVLVTLSSVGAGAIGASVLMTLYPYLSSYRIVGIDIAHAVPLTLIAGMGHLWLGNVDMGLLVGLLVGSLPAIYLGTHIGRQLPHRILQRLLASILMGLGLKFVFF
ncbi:hypothetical protein AB835_00015 [Candidatus Endobugula sertula]|uniref:Probable membrane transporter protein n=1 Tax=Candidatus Endobugula sertula TaxID=62101 RepID=A0A1D2QU27_9GAMM|nr:hypothetical protein AB835_00015 [Candidatus Endobugula sertula]